ncbi:hypothetical protein Tco_0133682 [Tanacetum coccineum]
MQVIPMVAATGSRQVKIQCRMLILDQQNDEVLKSKNFKEVFVTLIPNVFLEVRSRGSDFDIPVVFSLIIALLRNKLDFDVISWHGIVASHRATIDCYARTVIFGNVRQPEFVYHGSSPLKSVKLISAMKARTLISHGCQGFLASVMDTSLESPNIENLSVVREFADVFPDELLGLPPAREIEFGIELIPGC